MAWSSMDRNALSPLAEFGDVCGGCVMSSAAAGRVSGSGDGRIESSRLLKGDVSFSPRESPSDPMCVATIPLRPGIYAPDPSALCCCMPGHRFTGVGETRGGAAACVPPRRSLTNTSGEPGCEEVSMAEADSDGVGDPPEVM